MLIFRYGVMGSGKTARAIRAAEFYGEICAVMKPSKDTRAYGLYSRNGKCCNCYTFTYKANLYKKSKDLGVDVIIIDEAQFCTRKQINQLCKLSNEGYLVMCFGLLTDFRSNMFEGSKRLVEVSDKIEIVEEYICDCGKTAVVNARLDNKGNVVTKGSTISIGYNYKPMCMRCWYKKRERF